jgi:hypothetical protein
MQIYMDLLSESGTPYWKMYIDPNISIDSRGITINGAYHRYVEIARISIDGNEKIFKEAFVWAKRDEVVSDGAKELLSAKNLSIPVLTFLVENLAPECISNLNDDVPKISDVDLKKYARAMAVRLARENRDK